MIMTEPLTYNNYPKEIEIFYQTDFFDGNCIHLRNKKFGLTAKLNHTKSLKLINAYSNRIGISSFDITLELTEELFIRLASQKFFLSKYN